MRYDLIFCDADDTLFDYKKAERVWLERTFEAYHIAFSDEIYARYHAVNHAFWVLYEQGGITQSALRLRRFEQLFGELGVSADVEAFNRSYSAGLAQSTFLIDGAVALCRALHGRCSLYIVTNGTFDTQTARLAGSEIAPYISKMFVSEEIGHNKPHKEFFDCVFSRLHLEDADKSRMILLGDSLTSDMAGGRNAGIATCWFAPENAAGNGSYDYRISRLTEFLPIVMG